MDASSIVQATSVQAIPAETNRKVTPLALAATAIFFLSGLSALMYEVVWMRRLSLFFGSDVYSAAFTLSVYMAGLMIGSMLIGRFAGRVKNPLIWYGALEIAIGVYAVFFNDLLNLFAPEYGAVYRTWFDTAPWRYHLFRISVAASTLLIPTILMGATLPLMIRRFCRVGETARYSGLFYAVNTLGALTGTLLAGFLLVPLLGITLTTATASAINILIGSTAIVLSARKPGAEREDLDAGPTLDDNLVSPVRARHAALIGIALSGAGALALEVVWMRILTQSFSATVYSFSIMLACFLLGIVLGSGMAAQVLDRHAKPLIFFAQMEVLLGFTVAVLAVVCHFVPLVFSRLLWVLAGLSGGQFGIACTIAQFVVSGILILIPTMLLGATFPAAVRVLAPSHRTAAAGSAKAYAANTSGAIIGSLVAAFVLIPAIGVTGSLIAIAALFALTGLFLVASDTGGVKNLRHPEIVGITALATIAAVVALALPKQVVTNFYYAGNEGAQVIFQGEGVSHNIDIIRTPKGVTLMQVNGTIEADTSYSQRRHFILKAHLPLLLHPDPKDVAVVGLGLGITLSATARHPGIESVQVIELSPEMVSAHKYLREISAGVLERPNVTVRIDDGRNFLTMSDRQFDMITADPVHPRVTGVGYLYTREYYEAIKRRLRPNGIVCQWMPMYRISTKSFDAALRTFAEVFDNASFWYVRGHGLLVATQEPLSIDFSNLKARIANPVIAQDLASINIHGPEAFLSYLMMSSEQIRKYLAHTNDETLNTDDNAYLEYKTPFEFLHSTKDIVAGLIPYAGLDVSVLRNASADDRARIQQLWEARKAELMLELSWNLDQ